MGMAVLYSIRDWDKQFENAQSRKVEKLTWVPIPNKHDGLSYRRIITRKDGLEIYGAWCLIMQVASKCPTRGVLADSIGTPLTADDLASKTGAPAKAFEKAFEVLTDATVAWMICEPLPDVSQSAPSTTTRAGGMEGNEWKGMEGKEACAADAAACDESGSELRDWLVWWNGLKASGLVPHGCNPEEPSQGVIAGWKRVQSKPKLRGLLSDRDAIEREIRASEYCREEWFRLEKLFGGTNRDGELILTKLLDGAYQNHRRTNAKPNGAYGAGRTKASGGSNF